MIFFNRLSMVSVLIYTILVFHPLENTILNVICCIIFVALYAISMSVADICYDKLKSRIKALENKLNDKEERK